MNNEIKQQLEKANKELLELGVMLNLTQNNGEATYKMTILYGLDKDNLDPAKCSEGEDYADNYYESELEALINDARAYAIGKIKNLPVFWVVTNVTLSDSEYQANGYSYVKVFDSFEKAEQQKKQWADAEIELCNNEERDYEVLQDEPSCFRMGWAGNTEQIRIQIHEAGLNI